MKNVLGILFLFLLLSCTMNTGERIMSFSKDGSYPAKSIVFPNELEKDLSAQFGHSQYMLVLYFDSVHCIPCALERVKLLYNYQTDFDEMNTKIVMIVENSNEDFINDIRTKFKYPVLMDKGSFREANVVIYSLGYTAFVVDKNKNAVWLGSPIESEESWNRYKRIIKTNRN